MENVILSAGAASLRKAAAESKYPYMHEDAGNPIFRPTALQERMRDTCFLR